MANAKILLLLTLTLATFATAQNIQPVSVAYNETFNSVNITVINQSGDTLLDEQFFSVDNRTAMVAYLTGLTSVYDEVVNYSVAVNLSSTGTWTWIFTNTLGYLGRGNLTIGNLPISIPASGDELHVSSSAQIYTFVTGQGYLTSESDPLALAKFGTLDAGKYCKSDGAQVICTYTVPAAYDDTALWANASSQEARMQAIDDAWKLNASNLEGRIIAIEADYLKAADLNSLWSNASAQETHIGNLWANISATAVRLAGIDSSITDLWSNISANAVRLAGIDSSISSLWTNASDQQSSIGNLWTDSGNLWLNASSQEVRMQAIDDAWKANGSAAAEHIKNLWINASVQEGKIADSITNDTNNNAIFAALFLNDTNDNVAYQNLWGNASGQEARMQGIDDAWKANGSAAAEHINNLWTNASIQEGKIAALITNASDQQTHITNLWINASDQQANGWQKNSTCKWIRFT